MKWIVRVTVVATVLIGACGFVVAQTNRNQSGSVGGGTAPDGVAQVVMRRDVQAELGLSADQKTKIQTAISNLRAEMTKAMENRQGGDGRSVLAKLSKKLDDDVSAILTKPQQKRLEELRIQMLGNRALLDPKVQQALGITDAQRAQMARAQQDQRKTMQQMMDEMRKPGSDRSKVGEMLKKMQADMVKAMEGVLTEEQKTKFAAMKGKPFKGLTGPGG